LGTLRHNQKDYENAIEYLEEFFHNEVMDGRDTFALQKLEECYTSLGELEKAEIIQKRRMEASQILLWQDEVKTPEDDKEGSKEEEPAESVDGGCIEGFAVDNFENPNEKEDQDEENEEEDDDSTDEARDVEAEKQLLREQISEWEQRLKALERKGKEGNKGKETSA
jgi:tetratricopeptide (TPR) repeat protein